MGGTRQRHFDGTNLKPKKLPENAQTPTSRVHALLGNLTERDAYSLKKADTANLESILHTSVLHRNYQKKLAMLSVVVQYNLLRPRRSLLPFRFLKDFQRFASELEVAVGQSQATGA